MNVFVYGSLMKGYWNNKLLENSIYTGMAKLVDYEMYHVSGFPGIIRKCGDYIIGEVYEIDEETLKRLDELEDEGRMYIRQPEAIILENQEEIKAFVYVWNNKVDHYDKVEEKPWKPRQWRRKN